MQSHIRKVYACLAVTCHLRFWQNDRGLLRATAVTRGWNAYRNKSQHRKLTLEKKFLPPPQQGFEPATFRSRVRRSNHWAIPALLAFFCLPFLVQPSGAWLNLYTLSSSFHPVFPPADHCSDDLFFRQSSFLYFRYLNATASISLQSNCMFPFPQSKCFCSYYPSLNAFASISPSLMRLLSFPHPEWVCFHFPILNESAAISQPWISLLPFSHPEWICFCFPILNGSVSIFPSWMGLLPFLCSLNASVSISLV